MLMLNRIIHKIGGSTRSVSFLNSFFSALVGLGTFMLLTRVLSKADFGAWAFFISVFTMFDMLRSGMMGSAVVKFYTEDASEEQLSKTERAAGQLALRISLLTLFIPIIYWGAGLYKEYAGFQYISIAVVPLALINLFPSLATWFCHAKQDFKQLFLIRLIIQLSFMLFVVFGFVFEYTLNIVFIGYVLSWLLAAIYVLIRSLVKISWVFNRERMFRKELLDYGKYTMSTLLGSNLLKNSDTYLIMGFLGEVSVARYHVPDRILGFIDMPIRAFTTSDFPKFVALVNQKRFKDLQQAFNKGLGLAILMVWPLSLMVFVGAEELIYLIAGPKYGNSILILRIFSIYGLLLPLDRYTGIMIDALGFPKINARKVMAMLLVNIILDALFLFLGYGLNLVAMVSLATYSTGIVYGFFVINSQIKFQFRQSVSLAFQVVLSKIKS